MCDVCENNERYDYKNARWIKKQCNACTNLYVQCMKRQVGQKSKN